MGRGQRESKRRSEASSARVPRRGRPCAPIPRRGPATPGPGWAWPRALPGVPPTPACAPRLELAPNAAPELGRRRVPGKGCCLPAPPSPWPPGRVGSGRTGGEWAKVEAPGVENPGAEDADPTPLGLRNFPNTSGLGTRGVGSPALRLRVGGEGELHHQGLQGLPSPASAPLCASPRSIATRGLASSPLAATLVEEGRFLWSEEMGEAGSPALRHPDARGSRSQHRGGVGRGGLRICLREVRSFGQRPFTLGSVASRCLSFPRSSPPPAEFPALPSRGG